MKNQMYIALLAHLCWQDAGIKKKRRMQCPYRKSV